MKDIPVNFLKEAAKQFMATSPTLIWADFGTNIEPFHHKNAGIFRFIKTLYRGRDSRTDEGLRRDGNNHGIITLNDIIHHLSGNGRTDKDSSKNISNHETITLGDIINYYKDNGYGLTPEDCKMLCLKV